MSRVQIVCEHCKCVFASPKGHEGHRADETCDLKDFTPCESCGVFFKKSSKHSNCPGEPKFVEVLKLSEEFRHLTIAEASDRRSDAKREEYLPIVSIAANLDGTNRLDRMTSEDARKLVSNLLNTTKASLFFASEAHVLHVRDSTLGDTWELRAGLFTDKDLFAFAWDKTKWSPADTAPPKLLKSARAAFKVFQPRDPHHKHLRVAVVGCHLRSKISGEEKANAIAAMYDEVEGLCIKDSADIVIVLGDMNCDPTMLGDGKALFTPERYKRGTTKAKELIDNCLNTEACTIVSTSTFETNFSHFPIVQEWSRMKN